MDVVFPPLVIFYMFAAQFEHVFVKNNVRMILLVRVKFDFCGEVERRSKHPWLVCFTVVVVFPPGDILHVCGHSQFQHRSSSESCENDSSGSVKFDFWWR